MKSKILVFCLANLITVSVFSQKVTIEYLYKPTQYVKDSFDFFGLRPCNIFSLSKARFVVPINPISKSFGYEKGYSKSIATYFVSDTMPYFIGDGFGHQILLLPEDDTLRIKERQLIEHPPYFSKDSFLVPWTMEYEYTSKHNKAVEIYDSIDMSTGSILWDKIQLTKAGYNYDIFYNMCLDKYQERVNFINRYCRSHGIAPSIESLVIQEAKCGFIINLLSVFKQGNLLPDFLDNLPKKLKASLDSFELNNVRLFRKTNLYAKAVSEYSLLYMPYLYRNPDANDLIRNYELAKTNFEGEIRDFLIANLLKYYLKNPAKIYDSVLTDFKTFSKNISSTRYLDSARNIVLSEKKYPLLKS